MAIVYQHDKRYGITYAYDSEAYWDKETKKRRAKRKLIGRVDPETGEIVPTDGRNRKAMQNKEAGEEEDYKELYKKAMEQYEKALKQIAAQEALINHLRKELEQRDSPR
ncbi:MAG: hypothetical protein QM296_02520 [Bacillota bacterium]|nr:hypothetical protein [Bacillota bacterium]